MGFVQKLLGEKLVEFLRGLDRRALFIVLGVLLLGGSGLITYQGGPFNWISSSIIIALAVTGLLLVIVGLLTKGRFADWGMIDLRKFRDSRDTKAFLSRCKKEVIVLKTWFPEDDHIAGGLETAIRNGATIQLILCDPKACILGQRSRSTEHTPKTAATWIYNGLDVVLENASPRAFKGVYFYDAWPGCPVIWADGRTFMGFYFWGHTSPNQPWVEVKTNSDLWDVLKAQQRKIRESAAVELLTLEDLRKWIASNPRP